MSKHPGCYQSMSKENFVGHTNITLSHRLSHHLSSQSYIHAHIKEIDCKALFFY